MALVIPSLALAPGNMLCLHIPHGFHEDEDAIEQQVMKMAKSLGKSVERCRPATVTRHPCLEFLKRQRSVEWLAHAAKLSTQEAAEVIVRFGVPVREVLSCNAQTPRCLLGIVARLHLNPAVLIYSTAGIDPLGKMAVHRFAASESRLCTVHLSLPVVFGDGIPAPRHCHPKSLCIELLADSG